MNKSKKSESFFPSKIIELILTRNQGGLSRTDLGILGLGGLR